MFGGSGEETLYVMDSLLDSRIRFIRTGHFSDRVQSGRRKFLRAATAYRDHLIGHYPPLSRQAQCSLRRKNNRSGACGLVRVDVWETRRGRRLRRLYWDAQWPTGIGNAQHKKFSVKRYGERGAYLRALAARRAALRTLTS